MRKEVLGHLVDVWQRRIYDAKIVVDNNIICQIEPAQTVPDQYIIPGYVDAHVHIESSMLTPQRFARIAAAHGTVAVVTDPHEIANVCGIKGIEWMQADAKDAKIKINFTIPSCVPATPLDYSGAMIDSEATRALAKTGKFVGLSEMMNVPGVLNNDEEVKDKLAAAKEFNLPIDGHAPALRGTDLWHYASAGISTDHECSTLSEAEEKIAAGIHILIREGSAARNYEALHPLIDKYPDKVMFCTDDSHADDLVNEGHIDKIVKRAVADGHDLYNVLRAASVNAVMHYKLPVGLLREGDFADFQIVNNLKDFKTLELHCGKEEGKATQPSTHQPINNFKRGEITSEDLRTNRTNMPVIKVIPGQLLTFETDFHEPNVMKLVYLNRYHADSLPQIGYVTGMGLNQCALASSVAHDSHNIIAAGVSDEGIAAAINAVIAAKGGLAVAKGNHTEVLPLPVGGLMTDRPAEEVAQAYTRLNIMLKEDGCPLSSAFMTLSFLSLLVIPELKIGEKGLFRYSTFSWV